MGASSVASAADQATSLCTSCGLCCMGALHHSVLLVEDEVAGAQALGLDVINEARPVFSLPCPRLHGSCCGVYDRRPSSCGYYRCQLLRDLDAGTVDLTDALEKVGHAKKRLDSVISTLPDGMSLHQARAIALGRVTDARAGPELRLQVTTLAYYLDRHFLNDEDGKYFVVSDVSPGESKQI